MAACNSSWVQQLRMCVWLKSDPAIHELACHSLRELRDIALDCTVASDEPLNVAVDSCSICQNVPMNILSNLLIHFNMQHKCENTNKAETTQNTWKMIMSEVTFSLFISCKNNKSEYFRRVQEQSLELLRHWISVRCYLALKNFPQWICMRMWPMKWECLINGLR